MNGRAESTVTNKLYPSCTPPAEGSRGGSGGTYRHRWTTANVVLEPPPSPLNYVLSPLNYALSPLSYGRHEELHPNFKESIDQTSDGNQK